MFPSYLEVQKTGSQLFRPSQTLLQLFGERKKWIPAIQSPKMQSKSVRSKIKEYDMFLKSEKLVHSQQEHLKNVSQLFGSGKNWFLAISRLTNTVAVIWREKKVDLCNLETNKMQFTTVRCKEKDYDIYLKSEKLVHSQQEHEKNVSQLFGSGKNSFLAISSLTNTVAAIWREKKWIPAIWRPKNVVHNCQEQGKRL